MVAAAPSDALSAAAPASVAGSDGWITPLLDRVTEPSAAGSSPSALPPAVHEQARQALLRRPLPSRRDEAWRFTDPAPLTALSPVLLQPPSGEARFPAVAPGTLRLLLDGHSDPLEGVSLPDGVEPLTAQELQDRLGQAVEATGSADHWPVLLNGATASRVLALRVRGTVATTLELVSQAGAGQGVLPLRVLLILEEQASLEVLQVHRSSGANLTSLVLEASLGRGARLHHGLLAHGHGAGCLLATLAVQQAAGSDVTSVSAVGGWALARLEPRLIQSDGEARSCLRGLQLADGRQIADTHSEVVFAGPEGRLDQLHKAVADDAGRSVFNGAVKVPRKAQRTDAAQLSRNLLLSERARIDTKPELEIVADDVRCAHGATVSRLQQDELFYLQSRGIAADQAARLLLRGFCEEVLRELPAAATAWRPLASLMGEGGR